MAHFTVQTSVMNRFSSTHLLSMMVFVVCGDHVNNLLTYCLLLGVDHHLFDKFTVRHHHDSLLFNTMHDRLLRWIRRTPRQMPEQMQVTWDRSPKSTQNRSLRSRIWHQNQIKAYNVGPFPPSYFIQYHHFPSPWSIDDIHAAACREAAKTRSTWSARLETIKTLEGSADAKAQQTATERDTLVKQFDALSAQVQNLQEKVGKVPAVDTKDGIDVHPDDAHHGDDQEAPSLPAIDEEVEENILEEEEEESGISEDVKEYSNDDSDQHDGESAEELAQRVASQWIPGSKNKDVDDVDAHGEENGVELDMPSGDNEENPSLVADTGDHDVVSDDEVVNHDIAAIKLGLMGQLKSRIAGLVVSITGKKGYQAELLKARTWMMNKLACC